MNTAHCSGDGTTTNFAAIYDSKTDSCKLNANYIYGTSENVNGENVFSLVYQNTGSDNGGISELYVSQKCNSNATDITTAGLMLNEKQTTYHTAQESNMACPIFTMNALIQFVEEYWYIFGPSFIAVGFFFAFAGFKLFQIALFIVATIVVAGLLLFVFYSTFLSDNTATWVGWLVLALSVVLGLLGGFLTVYMEKFAGALLAAWGGFLLGVLLNETVVWLAGQAWLFWVINIVLALIFFLLGLKFFDHAVMISTSFIGSYMIMKGIGMMAGGFPNIYVLIKMIEDGAMDSIDPVFYAYLAGIVILTILTSIFQFKCWLKKKLEAETHPYQKLN